MVFVEAGFLGIHVARLPQCFGKHAPNVEMNAQQLTHFAFISQSSSSFMLLGRQRSFSRVPVDHRTGVGDRARKNVEAQKPCLLVFTCVGSAKIED